MKLAPTKSSPPSSWFPYGARALGRGVGVDVDPIQPEVRQETLVRCLRGVVVPVLTPRPPPRGEEGGGRGDPNKSGGAPLLF